MTAGQDPSDLPDVPLERDQSTADDDAVTTDQGGAGQTDPELVVRITNPLVDPIDEPSLPAKAPAQDPDARRIAPDPDPGDVIGQYDLKERLGRGGAGSVFRALNRSDGSIVALKVLSASKAKRARIVQRFFDEVRAASAVQHPGLIRVLDFIEEDDPRRLAYAMEFVDGETLRERMKRESALDLRDAIHVAAEVCDALAALHEKGIVHRDLKPENIMLLKHAREGTPRVKLLDFGVVKFLPLDRTGGAPAVDEKPGTFVGTPRYMAPEQAAGGVVDARSDLFAVGVVLFEMITGACPHEGDSLRDVVMAKLKGAPRITMNPGKELLPQELTEVVDACLQLKPALRPKDAMRVAQALREAEVVLFAVGPVKLDATGVPFRSSPSSPQLLTPEAATVRIEPHNPLSEPRGRPLDALPPPAIAQAPPPPSPPLATATGSGDLLRHASGDLPVVRVGPILVGAQQLRLMLILAAAIAVVIILVITVARALEPDQVLLVPLEGTPERTAKSAPNDVEYEVMVASIPSGASVRVQGESAGWTPHKVVVPKDVAEVLVELSMPGYRDRSISISRSTRAAVSVSLEPTAEGP